MADSITAAAALDGAPRIAVLDILRGIAILGILFMNINDMGGSLYASLGDVKHLGWSVTDQSAWWVREVAANGTARGMLQMLFGAGMVILTDRAAGLADDWAVTLRYYVRNVVLFLIGLVHVFILLWPGDILHTYGLAALVAFLFRQLRSGPLIALGMSLSLFIALSGGSYALLTQQQTAETQRIEAKLAVGRSATPGERKLLSIAAEQGADRDETRAEKDAQIAAEDAARTGTFRSWAGAQWGTFIDRQSLETLFVWEAASVMLIGAALFKLGIIQGARSRRFYLRLTVIGYGIGVPLRIFGGFAQTAPPGSDSQLAESGYEIARIAMTLGHLGIINLLVTSATGAAILRPFIAAGRTALSIYVAQTLICLWVLYPPFVFGLYGHMTWGPLMVTAFLINAALLWGANLWVRHFDIAPVEWAWRSLVERRMLPWRRTRAAMTSDPLPA